MPGRADGTPEPIADPSGSEESPIARAGLDGDLARRRAAGEPPPGPFPAGHPDPRWMKEAIRVAHVSRERGDYAFGAVLVRDDKIATASGNKVITYRDPTGHAELNCLRKAALREGHRHLRPGAVLYCTHAPCPMCLAMCVWTKVSGVVYGCYQADIGAWGREHSGSVFTWRSVRIEPDELYQSLREAHPTMAIRGGFQREECLALFHD